MMEESRLAREKVSHKPGILVGMQSNANPGLYLTNYANCLLNRQIDIFDDATFLLNNSKVPAACIISRGMLETYAFAKLLSKKIANILIAKDGKESVEASLKLILSFTNSSRLKEAEQKKVQKGIFSTSDYKFTKQARHRLENRLAGSEHVMNALRDLYEDEINSTKEKESQFEILYDALSEWVHPSQTSVFHNYVPETHHIPTSLGFLHLYDGARLSCARALHFITDSVNVYEWTLELANAMTLRRSKYK
jgi:hypothetical protein